MILLTRNLLICSSRKKDFQGMKTRLTIYDYFGAIRLWIKLKSKGWTFPYDLSEFLVMAVRPFFPPRYWFVQLEVSALFRLILQP